MIKNFFLCIWSGLKAIDYDIKNIDNIIISVGGGGLIAGVGSVIRQKFPKCRIIGVEPEGAKGLTDSLEKGYPINSVKINTLDKSMAITTFPIKNMFL